MIIKYTNEKYVDSMLKQGRVSLGTFWHFQTYEHSEIGDPEEGQSGFMFRNDTAEPWDIKPVLLDAAAMSTEGHPRYTESKILMPGDEGWIESAGGFNTFMYSLTKADAPSRKLMDRLGYDSAVEVVDVEAFVTHTGQALKQHMNKELGFDRYGYTRLRCITGPVGYVSSKRRVVTPSSVDILQSRDPMDAKDMFTKIKIFEYQSEFRIAYFFMNPRTDKIVSMDNRLPSLYPVIVGDAGIPRISKTFRHIEPSEFVD